MGRKRNRRGLSVALFALGLIMLGAAIWAVASQGETVSMAWEAARGASPWLVVACIALPVLNWVFTSATIWVLTGRYGKVRPTEMLALIGAAWLLNMLPMRPGMFGRLAYHRKFNGIRVRDSMRVLVAALLCSGCALGCLLVVVVFAPRILGSGTKGGSAAAAIPFWSTAGLLLLPPVLLGLAGAGTRMMRKDVWRWPAAVAFRYCDMLTWMVRYMIVFAIIGRPIGLIAAGAVVTVSQGAMMTPVQLGLREWVVAVTSASLPGGEREGTLMEAAAPGLLADVVMRAAELLIVLPVGLVASAWLWRRMRRPGWGTGSREPGVNGPSEFAQEDNIGQT